MPIYDKLQVVSFALYRRKFFQLSMLNYHKKKLLFHASSPLTVWSTLKNVIVSVRKSYELKHNAFRFRNYSTEHVDKKQRGGLVTKNCLVTLFLQLSLLFIPQ